MVESPKIQVKKEVFLLIFFGIILPTSDVYSDVVLIHQLFTNPTHFKCHSHVIPSTDVRDGYNDCDDGSDEYGK